MEELTGIDDAAIDDESCPGSDNVYPIVYSRSRSIFVGTVDDEALLEQFSPTPLFGPIGSDGAVVYSLAASPDERLDVEGLSTDEPLLRQHYFAMNPIDRGHPVDKPDATNVGEGYIPTAQGGGNVAVIDVGPGHGGDFAEHGTFIVSVLEQMVATANLEEIDAIAGASDGLFFLEESVIGAIGQVETTGGYDAVNISLGTYACEDYESRMALLQVVQRATTQIVASAGNAGVSQPVYPAAFDDVIGVGSTAADGKRSCFSNFGPWVDYWVPGEEVLGIVQGADATWSGTSFAAPQVAAEVAGGISASASMPTDLAPDGGYGCPP